MEWETRLTKLLGCRYPILQGAMARFGTWQFAAAVAQAGALGNITASISRSPEGLRLDIKSCKGATVGSPGTFGVNLSIGICPSIEQMLEVSIEEKVPVETSVYKPDALAPRIKASGVKWIHKAARVKDALHAQELGADAIILVGLEGAGIKNPEQLPTMTTIIWGRRMINVPLVAAGGIGDAHGLLAALGMGADGIMMGTAFMVTKECPLKEASKEAILRLRPDNPELRQRVLTPGAPWRPGNATAPPTPEPPRESEWGGEASFATGVIDYIPTVKEFINNIVQGAEHILDSWEFLKTE